MNLISCQNLSIGYKNKQVVENLTFCVVENQFLCILGNNGSGKSTLMRTILGLEKPLSGEIQYGEGLKTGKISYKNKPKSCKGSDDNKSKNCKDSVDNKSKNCKDSDDNKQKSCKSSDDSKPKSCKDSVDSKPKSCKDSVDSKPKNCKDSVDNKSKNCKDSDDNKSKNCKDSVDSKPKNCKDSVDSKPKNCKDSVDSKPRNCKDSVDSKTKSLSKPKIRRQKSCGIGYLPQQTPAQKDFPATALEVVLSGTLGSCSFLPIYTKKQKAAAKESMARLGISSLEKRCYRELSGGQQQRVLLARAICASSKLIVLDEPTTALDPEAAKEMYRAIKELHDSGVTVIMVSHDAEEAVKYATHILHIANRPKFFGTVEDYMKTDLAKSLKCRSRVADSSFEKRDLLKSQGEGGDE